MDYTEYKNRVINRFNNSKNVKIEAYITEVFYEEEFKLVWFATKLKMFSFISYSNIVKEDTIFTLYMLRVLLTKFRSERSIL